MKPQDEILIIEQLLLTEQIKLNAYIKAATEIIELYEAKLDVLKRREK